MIKFFRKIRQSLIAEGKFRQYLKYAIGEIVLVVIGILVALSINSWNNDRVTEKETRAFLVSLHRDLTNDHKRIEDVIKEQKNRYDALSAMISLSKDPEIMKIAKSDTAGLTKTGRNFTFFPIIGAYKSANNSGLLENVKDDSLKHNIYNLYEHLYPRLNYNGEINDSRFERVDWESRKYVDYSETQLSFEIQALLEQDFVDQIGFLSRFIRIYIARCNQVKDSIQSVLDQIEDQLEDNDQFL